MSVSIAERLDLAYAAGFRGSALLTIVSISLCECGVGSVCETGCNPDCCPPCDSCGLLQVYQCAHPGTAPCAVDPACAFRLGWQISNGGTSFTPWTTYNDGCFRGHMAAVAAVLAGLPPPVGPPRPSSLPSSSPLAGTPPSGGVGAPALLAVAGGAVLGGLWWRGHARGGVRLPALVRPSRR
ncbi:MAG TPA: hypothetical protein VMU89_14880 [Thermomicrobiaceae bacterium]|nr:hypothetical protein [Thermomicrobiaceae bacterium]